MEENHNRARSNPGPFYLVRRRRIGAAKLFARSLGKSYELRRFLGNTRTLDPWRTLPLMITGKLGFGFTAQRCCSVPDSGLVLPLTRRMSCRKPSYAFGGTSEA